MVSRQLWTSKEKREIIYRIRTHASGSPQRIALEYGTRAVTYRALIERLDQRLLALADAVRPGQFVAIECPRSVEYVVDFLAILALGGIPVPLDLDMPVGHRDRRRELIGSGVPAATAVDGAYVLFTPGDVPLPVLGSGSALRAFLDWQRAEFDIKRDDRFALLSDLGSEAMVREMFSPLWAGATLVIPAEQECDWPETTVAWLDRRAISVVDVTPSVAREWLRHGQNRCDSVRTVFFAGEPVPANLLGAWHTMFPGTRNRVSYYGPIEAGLPTVHKRLRRSYDGPGNLAAGRPVPGTRYCVIEPALRLWSPNLVRAALENPGTEGEVVLVSRYPSYGYVGLPEETGARFVDLGDGLTAYRTGDRGRLERGGELSILGRISGAAAQRQEKLSG